MLGVYGKMMGSLGDADTKRHKEAEWKAAEAIASDIL